MNIEVIILAQGTQKRLGAPHGFKQLLRLPACGDAPILGRTLRQLADLSDAGMPVKLPTPTIVTWERLSSEACDAYPKLFNWAGVVFRKLASPGNSSLKGIARYLEEQPQDRGYDGTIVLLGDVVYSWSCLLSLLWLSQMSWGFTGTSDLSNGGGELWGVAWSKSYEQRMLADLRDALLRHPPFEDEYQPGQMRRWIAGWRRGDISDHVRQLIRSGNYRPINDYTMDVDLPEHIAKLQAVSELAAADDLAHGMAWPA